MLIPELNCIFIHVPKTAGQSIERHLLETVGAKYSERHHYLLKPNNDSDRGPPRLAHLRARDYVKYGYIDPNKFEKYFKFAFVRNPWARLVSAYQFLGINKKCSFNDWVLGNFPLPGFSSEWLHVMPQSDYLHGSKGQLLVNFVGRFENLHNDYGEVCSKLNVEFSDLPHVNRSKRSFSIIFKNIIRYHYSTDFRNSRLSIKSNDKDYWKYFYDVNTFDFVTSFYADDINNFDYRFD